MRVLVASDTVGVLTSRQAGEAIGSGWAGADVRVLPVGDSGHGFLTAYADLQEAAVEAALDGEYLVTTARTAREVTLEVTGPVSPEGCRSRPPRDRSATPWPGRWTSTAPTPWSST